MDAAKFWTVLALASSFAQASSREPVPFSLLEGYLIVAKGQIGGLPDLNLVVDTGTARTVIDIRIATQLRLAKGRSAAEVFGATVPTHRAVVDTLAFGHVHAAKLEVLVADLSAQERRFARRIDALVGVDVLRTACLTIDYASRRLAADCASPLPLIASLTPSMPVVDVSIEGHSYRLIADTGSEAIAVFRTSIPADARVVPDGRFSATHLTGTMELTRFTPKRFLVGGHSIGTPPVFILDSDARSLGYDGVLGTRWLTASVVRFDLSKGLLSWVGFRSFPGRP